MTARQIKGMNLAQTVTFLDEHLSHVQREQVHALLSNSLKAKLRSIDTSEWYPVEDQIEIQRAMAKVVGSEEAADLLTRQLGGHLFRAALGTFMRLVLRVLTPAMFLKKTADIWPRMFAFGSFEADPSTMSQGSVTMIMRGVEGCDYFPNVSAGFIHEAIVAIGHKDVNVVVEPIPGEPEGNYRFHVSWT